MALEAHLAELSEKHRKLKAAVEQEMQRPSYDPIRIAELKKEKLRIKDQIERLKTSSVH